MRSFNKNMTVDYLLEFYKISMFDKDNLKTFINKIFNQKIKPNYKIVIDTIMSKICENKLVNQYSDIIILITTKCNNIHEITGNIITINIIDKLYIYRNDFNNDIFDQIYDIQPKNDFVQNYIKLYENTLQNNSINGIIVEESSDDDSSDDDSSSKVRLGSKVLNGRHGNIFRETYSLEKGSNENAKQKEIAEAKANAEANAKKAEEEAKAIAKANAKETEEKAKANAKAIENAKKAEEKAIANAKAIENAKKAEEKAIANAKAKAKAIENAKKANENNIE